jgi:hypothetical protein
MLDIVKHQVAAAPFFVSCRGLGVDDIPQLYDVLVSAFPQVLYLSERSDREAVLFAHHVELLESDFFDLVCLWIYVVGAVNFAEGAFSDLLYVFVALERVLLGFRKLVFELRCELN